MKKPRILIFDTETAYVVARLWRTGEQYVNHEQLAADVPPGIICICYKWLGEKKIHELQWDSKQGSKKMIQEFTKVVESADVVVAHNGDKFDIKKVNTQVLVHGLPPISWPPCEDTLKIARKYFALPSNKLDYLAKLLLGIGKIPTNFKLWEDIIERNCKKSMKYMIKYCKRDVSILEDVYAKLKTYATPKVSRSILLHDHKKGCPACGSLNIRSNGIRTTASGKYRRSGCDDCGHQFKSEAIKLTK